MRRLFTNRVAVFTTVALLGVFTVPCARADTLDDALAEARGLLESGKETDAAAKFEALRANVIQQLDMAPNDAHLNYLMGSIGMYNGEDAVAEKSLDKAVKLEPANGTYQTARGTLFLFQDNPKEALACLKRGTELSPKSPEGWKMLGTAQLQAKDFAAAQVTFQKALDLQPRQARYLGLLADAQLGAGKRDDALKSYQKAITIDPKYALAYANIGQFEQTDGRFPEALAAYQKVLELNPEDWKALAKEVQLHAALHQTKERDAAREKILMLWKAGKIDQPMFCREQFVQNKQQIMVFEYFELKGDKAVRYGFNILDPQGKVVRRISLGSYDATNAIAHETGELKPGERLFHLDDYTLTTHATLVMFKKEPAYEVTRAMVVDALDGRLAPISGGAPATAPPP